MSEQTRLQGTMSTLPGVKIDMPGHMGPERPIGGWPNLLEVANLTIRHMNEMSDPHLGYLCYSGASLGWKTPALNRSMWDWVEASSYALCGRIAARRLTGNRAGEEVEIGQRKWTLASFHNLDGLAHRFYAAGWSEDRAIVLWEQARVLFTLMAWFVESEDERLLEYVRGMLRALTRMTHTEGHYRVFDLPRSTYDALDESAPMVLVEPLMRYYQATSDPDALSFCEGIVRWALAPETGFYDERYRLSGNPRIFGAALAAMTRYAVQTADESLLELLERLFRSAVDQFTAYGATPDGEPCCALMEFTTAALALTLAGHGEWWDDIDRWFRNQVLACQYTDPTLVEVGYMPREPAPSDDVRDVLNRAIGGFSWATAREHNYTSGKVMLCCTGNAMWTLGKIVSSAVTLDDWGMTVNLHYTLDTPLASLTNHEPFAGRLEVVPKRTGNLKVRLPSFAPHVEATLDGVPIAPRKQGAHLVLDSVQAGSRLVLSYPLTERSTVETTRTWPGRYAFGPKSDPVLKEEVHTTWRGNTVLAIDYDKDSPHPKHRLYLDRMARYRAGEGRDAVEAFFLPDKPYCW